MKNFLRQLRYDGRMYFTNRIVGRIPSHTLRLWYYRSFMKLKIGPRSYIFMDAMFDTVGGFDMGAQSTVNSKCRLDNRGGITIGENVSISAEVCILTADHDPNSAVAEARVKPVIIENYAFVGTRAMILPGVTIGYGAIVAAGSVVTKDVLAFTIVAGVPARKIGERKTEFKYSGSYLRFFF